eukprot:UN27207
MLRGYKPEELLDVISVSDDLDKSLTDTIYVQECVPEDPELKKKVHRTISDSLEKINNYTAIVATSSSNICTSEFSDGLSNKDRLLVSHPINPPFAIPLVEIVPSESTTNE